MSTGGPLARSIGLALAACSLPAGAMELNYSVATALGYSDDVNQSGTDPVGQSMLIPRLNFDLKEDGAYLRAHAVGQLEYRDYLQGAFGNEVRGELSALATWMILPDRLNFAFEDYASVQPINQLEPNAPGNQQQINVFTLGPTFNFRLAQTLNGQAELRVSDSTASQTHEFDSTRATAALRALKDFSKLDRVSANVEVEDVHFSDASGGPDYRRSEAFARYQSKLNQLDIDIAAGYSQVDFSSQTGLLPPVRSQSGPLARGAVSWRMTPSQTLTLGATREFGDVTQDLAVDPSAWVARASGSGIVTGTLPIDSQVFLERNVDASYTFQNARFRLRLEPYRRKLDYLIDSTFDQTATGGTLSASYRLRPLWTLAFEAGDESRNYSMIQRRDEDRRYDLSFTDQLLRQWSVRFDLIRNERRSTAAGQDFRENVAFCTFIFTR